MDKVSVYRPYMTATLSRPDSVYHKHYCSTTRRYSTPLFFICPV